MLTGRAAVLADLVRERGWKCGAEIGVHKGHTTRALVAEFPTLHMLAVDHWAASLPTGRRQDKRTGETTYTQAELDEAEREAREALAPYEKQVRIIKALSTLAAFDVPDHSLDFVFLDADHRTVSVCEDIVAWRPKIMAGGALLGHDADWPSVQAALALVFGSDWRALDANVWMREGWNG